MTRKKTEIDFGVVFINGQADASLITGKIEKAVQVNADTIIEEGAYKHRQSPADRPMRLKVTVELAKG